MGHIKVLITFATILFLLCACSTKMTTSSVREPVVENNANMQPAATPPPIITQKKSQIRSVNPMDGKRFTFTAREAKAQTVLYAIAIDTGLNLVVNPDVGEDATISANFVNTPMQDALDVIMDMSDLNYEIKGNVLRIYRYHTANFNVPYVTTSGKHSTTLGGDVVGGADQEGNTNLKGEFILDYTKAEETTDFFKQVEANLTNILGSDTGSSFTINRVSGVVTVRSTHNKLKEIHTFLNNVVENSMRQVQIEAKIVEVTLNDSWSYGIDWSYIFGNGVTFSQTLGSVSGAAGQLSIVNGSFTGVLNAVATYGKVDTLSNPRITVMNGQSAMITAGTIIPYWERKVETQDSSAGGYRQEYGYEKFNVLDGVMIGVTAFIHDDGTVMLNVVPITTSIGEPKKIVDDLGVVQAEAPEISIKEAGTIVQVDDGAMLVIGGLISNVKETKSSRIPILGDIPLLGYFFSNESVSYSKRELVIFIKPTIVYGTSKVMVK